MLFNSPIYIFIFLPIVVFVYFLLNRWRLVTAGKAWLVSASLYFYAYWNTDYLLIIIGSMLVNYAIGSSFNKSRANQSGIIRKKHRHLSKKAILVTGIIFNLSLLGYFKYADFFIGNLNQLAGSSFEFLNLLLPLAISFFTFQQIAYLIDSYQDESHEYDFLNYCLFVTFFPQLIAGPIVHHKEMMPQFSRLRNYFYNFDNIAKGLIIFSIGLFKKVGIADSFALWADAGFDTETQLSFFEAWGASLSYTFQLYYDFSGYSDMAIGAALMFNIRLPVNFNSPYKAINIQDFWRRWHITLSRWLRDYLYIPLGGNRKGPSRAIVNSTTTMLLGGLWHGAGWTFVLWGGLHAMAMAIHRAWGLLNINLPRFVAWFITFMFINFSWVFFRAESVDGAMNIIRGMLGYNGIALTDSVALRLEGMGVQGASLLYSKDYEFVVGEKAAGLIIVFGLVAFLAKNSLQILDAIKEYKIRHIILVAWALFFALTSAITNQPSQFLYFNF